MTAMLATWRELHPLDGPALLIVNAAAGDETAVGAAFAALAEKAVAGGVHVIAPPNWRQWLRDLGQPDERVLISADEEGRETELTHFLHSSIALPWIASRGFKVVMGALPHNLYNEEVQGPLEQQVCLFLEAGQFFAHTLPNPYIYVFDAAALVHRFGRAADVDHYTAVTRQLIDDLHGQWLAAGKPAVDDSGRHDDVMAALGRHLDRHVIGFDESCPVLPRVSHWGVREVASYLQTLRGELVERDRRLTSLTELVAERSAAVMTRDAMLADLQAERNSAVELRDGIIAELRMEAEDARRFGRRLKAVFLSPRRPR